MGLFFFGPTTTAKIRTGWPANLGTSRIKIDILTTRCFLLTSPSHEAANFSSRVSVSLRLTEHVGLVPPPIFRDRDVYLFLFICWPTPLNKTSFLKIFPSTFGVASRQRIVVNQGWMVSFQASVMWLRTCCLGFVLAACCLVMSCHRASGESKFHQFSYLIITLHHRM